MEHIQKLRLIPNSTYQDMMYGKGPKTVTDQDITLEKGNTTVTNEDSQNTSTPEKPEKPEETSSEEPTKEPTKEPMTISAILEYIPSYLRGQAQSILNIIREHPQMSWDERGRISINGNIQENTNIPQLVRYVVKPLRNFKPIGADEFQAELSLMGYSKRPPRKTVGRLSPPPGKRVHKRKKSATFKSNWKKIF